MLKNTIFTLSIITFGIMVAFQLSPSDSTPPTQEIHKVAKSQLKPEGINFFKGSWDDALKKAKDEDKLIFLDVYATWCGPCKMLKANVFPNTDVGEFYNKNFVNLTLDGEKGKGKELARKYGVRAYPTLLFIDHEGKVVSSTAGYRDPKAFLEMGKKVVK